MYLHILAVENTIAYNVYIDNVFALASGESISWSVDSAASPDIRVSSLSTCRSILSRMERQATGKLLTWLPLRYILYLDSMYKCTHAHTHNLHRYRSLICTAMHQHHFLCTKVVCYLILFGVHVFLTDFAKTCWRVQQEYWQHSTMLQTTH